MLEFAHHYTLLHSVQGVVCCLLSVVCCLLFVVVVVVVVVVAVVVAGPQIQAWTDAVVFLRKIHSEKNVCLKTPQMPGFDGGFENPNKRSNIQLHSGKTKIAIEHPHFILEIYLQIQMVHFPASYKRTYLQNPRPDRTGPTLIYMRSCGTFFFITVNFPTIVVFHYLLPCPKKSMPPPENEHMSPKGPFQIERIVFQPEFLKAGKLLVFGGVRFLTTTPSPENEWLED